MTQYEMVTILDPGLDAAGFEAKTKALEEGIREHGGEIQKVTPWGKRRLAYDIRKKDAGWYVVLDFEGKPDGLLAFKESIRHDLEILRYLVVVREHPLAPAEVTPVKPAAAAAEPAAAAAAPETRAAEPEAAAPETQAAEPEAAKPGEESVEPGTAEDREDS